MNKFKKLATCLAIGAAALVLPATTAHAAPAPTFGVVGGNAPLTMTISGTPGQVLVNMDCSRSRGRITLQPWASALSGWQAGQWVTYRYYLRSRTTGWSTVSPFYAASYSAQNYILSSVQTPRPDGTMSWSNSIPVAPGHSWDVSVQVAWWSGSQWLYGGWNGPTGGYTFENGFAKYTSCST